MKHYIKPILLSIAIVATFCFVIRGVMADDTPELVSLHSAAIKAAQESNRKLTPDLQALQSQVNANSAAATASRQLICAQFPKYCTKAYLDPLGTGTVDPSNFR